MNYAFCRRSWSELLSNFQFHQTIIKFWDKLAAKYSKLFSYRVRPDSKRDLRSQYYSLYEWERHYCSNHHWIFILKHLDEFIHSWFILWINEKKRNAIRENLYKWKAFDMQLLIFIFQHWFWDNIRWRTSKWLELHSKIFWVSTQCSEHTKYYHSWFSCEKRGERSLHHCLYSHNMFLSLSVLW